MTEHDLRAAPRDQDLGCWTECECGWVSDRYKTIHGAHIAHVRHKLAEAAP